MCLSTGPVPLTPEQEEKKEELSSLLNEINDDISSNRDCQGKFDQLEVLARELHLTLVDSGYPPRHHRYMIENRNMQPDQNGFYRHIHPVQDLLKFICEQSSNDDPEDQTIDHKFEFEVFSRRCGHTDTYRITRTGTGVFNFSTSFH